MNGIVGIVVPVYKTEKYVSNCIESVLAQTYPHFRLILVDDATPDNAGAICDDYANRDSRITVIHQENTGASRARANGVAVADDCDFITFLDSDDTFTPYALQEFVSAMTPDADIVISYRVANVSLYKPIVQNQITVEEYRKFLLYRKVSCAPWGKLFRRSLFDDYTFSIPREIVVGEDMLMNLRLSHNSSKCVNVVHRDLYNYNIYDGNTSTRFVSTPQFEALWHRLIIESIADKKVREGFERFSIRRRFSKYVDFGGFELHNEELVATDFYKDLKADIAKYKYRLSLRKRILFNSSNVALRSFAIKFKQFSTKVEELFKHPDSDVWHKVLKDMRRYRMYENRFSDGYFYSKPFTLNKKKRVVCLYDPLVKNGGWADRLRGILSVYHVCRKRNIEFKILFTHPFDLERYLLPNKVQWGIAAKELDYNLNCTDLCYMPARTGREYEMRKQEKWFKKEFKRKYGEFHVRTNAAFSYKYDYAALFNELFRPSPLLVELLDKQKRLIGCDYISVSFRFLDLLGDFNETCSRGIILSEQERQELIAKCIRQIELLHEKHPQYKVLVNSDSKTLLQTADKLDYTYIVPGEISHVDSPEQVEANLHDKTITDFFMIGNAQSVYLVVADKMYESGFPYAASRLYNRPFNKIYC